MTFWSCQYRKRRCSICRTCGKSRLWLYTAIPRIHAIRLSHISKVRSSAGYRLSMIPFYIGITLRTVSDKATKRNMSS
ncbi:hypothetical protein METSCH_A04230 [Metschnikowia aff. pulcherrima]|uniref:Uncharacterized protein n=1 Tax=Metschnikowia aff. pulcherrima TaxID=2163413 RepID=A0A4P6XEC8_9ASCO|nr:hypothetical protein METSCH_A04230 [Metschnikowia aff. pulcherrima]